MVRHGPTKVRHPGPVLSQTFTVFLRVTCSFALALERLGESLVHLRRPLALLLVFWSCFIFHQLMSPQHSALSPEFSALSPQASALNPQPAALFPHHSSRTLIRALDFASLLQCISSHYVTSSRDATVSCASVLPCIRALDFTCLLRPRSSHGVTSSREYTVSCASVFRHPRT